MCGCVNRCNLRGADPRLERGRLSLAHKPLPITTAMDNDQNANSKSMMQVLANLMRSQASSSGVKLTDESMAQVLVTNMQRLLKEGKLTQEQIMQVCGNPSALFCNFISLHTIR